MMLFTSETSLTARIAAGGQEWPALKLPDILGCAKITRHDYTATLNISTFVKSLMFYCVVSAVLYIYDKCIDLN